MVLELKGNIRVFARVRPQLKHESGAGCENAIFFKHERPDLDDNSISVLDDSKGSEKTFEFDYCFGPESTQEQVFAEVEALVTSVLDGYNVCIFAYGQTGSGKTFSMEGSKDQPGIFLRLIYIYMYIYIYIYCTIHSCTYICKYVCVCVCHRYCTIHS